MTSTAAALLAIVATALLAIFGAIWRLGSKIGGMTQELRDHNGRLGTLETHVYAHDQWHLTRGDR